MAGSSVLLLGDYEPYVTRAEVHAREFLDVRQVIRHTRAHKALLDEVRDAEWLLNFLSAPRVTKGILSRFKAINFHPAPPEYPGVGSASMAIHDKREWHGVTAHVMDGEFDHGPILTVRRFRIDPKWGYGDLWDRSLDECLALFKEFIEGIAVGTIPLPSGDRWASKAITRKEFEKHPAFASVAK